ncbi:senecionine N-oxygenase [Chironomus tepperi]|uniref:senecionine N-oxygenase n=1 Tax=Chironomus tepperi TaxID=113505 RepID=UPI00391EF9DC
MKLCVIGSGAAGLAAAKNGMNSGCEVIVFEQSNQVGGTWVYDENIGKNKYGINVHSSMYQGLHTNLPKEIMGYPDFPIPAQEKSYISSKDMLDFLNLYSDTFKIRKQILFEHHVLRVSPLNDETWEVIVRDLKKNEYKMFNFDAVLVCSGHYHTPTFPKYQGADIFEGKQIHSHDYRRSDLFKNENVLVIGGGPSGFDLANEISKTANRVTLSHHLKEPPKTKFQSNVDQKPDVLYLEKKNVVFNDGTSREYSVIFYCTGYKYTFPFLSVDCGITCDDNFVRPLYKHCLSITRPSLGFIGLPFYVCATQMFDLQARFCLKFINKEKELPSKEEMMQDFRDEMNKRTTKGLKKHQFHMMGPEQNKYYDDLARTADIEPLKPVITKLHNWSSMRFLDDLTNFRKDVFRILDDETFIKVQ